MKKYWPHEIEKKWQEIWTDEKIYTPDLSKPHKFYVLAEFTYPSGDLHMGHWFTFSGADIYARFKKMQGYSVFFPNGFDAFGLPAENAAIKRGIHPKDWTMSNIARMKEQFASMGGSFSFEHEVVTCLPEYYRWNQWIFLKMLEKGLAYRGSFLANWCPDCQTVLANEGVEAGLCWRCGSEVIQKEVNQWFFKITNYAERLLWKEVEGPERSRTFDRLSTTLSASRMGRRIDWPKSLQEAQNNWIGKSEGTLIKFQVPSSKFQIEVFTTRPDTIFGATFVVISPEHPLLNDLTKPKQKKAVEEYVLAANKKSELERKSSSGVFTGSYVKNPMTGEKIPVWVANYVLMDYGTGAIMAVPAHDSRDFEFAKKYGLEIKTVIQPHKDQPCKANEAYEEEGVLVNSGEFTGLDSVQAREKISDYLEKNHLGKRQVQYHLRDWSISRQRYWGTPIPMIHCPKCGAVPVPEKDLPVELPYDVDYTPKGKSPLASNEKWLKVKCPKCEGGARRDPDTMDTFVDSSWYFFRYLSPQFDQAPFEADLAKRIMPVDIYFGGAEHNLGHTLYSRFLTKFFHDLGMIDLEEYALRRINHGIVLGPDGQKMSKSRGNVVNPDDEVQKFGADAVRIHLAFFMPYDGTGPWISERIWGSYRFLNRVWGLQEKMAIGHPEPDSGSIKTIGIDSGSEAGMTIADLKIMHKTIKKVTEDIEGIRFNTAVAALMEWLNHLSRKEQVFIEEYKTFLLLLAPFAPHITEELWQATHRHPEPIRPEGSRPRRLDSGSISIDSDFCQNDKGWFIHQQSYPVFDKKYLEEEEVTIVVQINGKIRDTLLIQKEIASDSKVVEKMAKKSSKIQKFLNGQSASWRIKKTVYIPVKIINFVIGSE